MLCSAVADGEERPRPHASDHLRLCHRLQSKRLGARELLRPSAADDVDGIRRGQLEKVTAKKIACFFESVDKINVDVDFVDR